MLLPEISPLQSLRLQNYERLRHERPSTKFKTKYGGGLLGLPNSLNLERRNLNSEKAAVANLEQHKCLNPVTSNLYRLPFDKMEELKSGVTLEGYYFQCEAKLLRGDLNFTRTNLKTMISPNTEEQILATLIRHFE